MVITHFTQHFHPGFMKSMAVVPCHSKEGVKNDITINLDSLNHWGHSWAIQPELGGILCQAQVVEWEEMGVGLDVVRVELLQDKPGGGEGRAGYQEGLHCPLVSHGGVPAVWESTQTTFIPGNPVTRECLDPVPPRQEPCLCGGQGCTKLFLYWVVLVWILWNGK